MNGKRIALTMIAVLGISLAESTGSEPKESAVRIVYLGIHDGNLKLTGEAIRAAFFRIENDTAYPVQFLLASGRPEPMIRQKTDDGWRIAIWNWCATGKRTATLEPSESRTWYVDPAYYSGKYGEHLQFGVWLGSSTLPPDDDRRKRPWIVWSDPVAFPKVDNPPETEFSGALHRAIMKARKDNSSEQVPTMRAWRGRRKFRVR